MKPIVFTLIATVCYAVCNVLLEVKFSKLNALTLMIVYASVIWVSAVSMRQVMKTNEPSFNFPVGKTLALAIVLGLIYAAGDYFFVGAYTHGGDVVTITCITMLIPVVASLLKFSIARQLPNVLQLSGYLLAALAVFLVSKGSITK
jgi:drug/metabolite transporter (DMT)-like permease